MAKAYDPVMHTAEHVLNGVMVRRFGCARCFSTHINSGKSKVDFRFPRDLSGEEARAVEAEVNAELAEGHAVTARFMPREEAARRFNLSRLPESAGENLRIVYVGDPDSPVDACPCIGEHVENTLRFGRFAWCSHDFTPPGHGQSLFAGQPKVYRPLNHHLQTSYFLLLIVLCLHFTYFSSFFLKNAPIDFFFRPRAHTLLSIS